MCDRNNKQRIRSCWLVGWCRLPAVLLVWLALVPAASALDFPVPEFFDLSIVAEDMSYSGVAMSVSRFTSRQPVAEIRKFYARKWPETRVVETDELFVISYLDEKKGLLFTVQVLHADWRDLSDPEGLLAVSDLPAQLDKDPSKLPKKGKNFPLHITGQVINDMVFHDGRKRSRFLYIAHKANARTIHEHYLRSMQKRGWSVSHSSFDVSGHKGIIRLKKNNRHMDITLAFQAGKTQMTAVELN